MQQLVIVLAVGLTTAADEPKTAQEWYKRGQERMARRKFDDAVTAFGECLRLDDKHADALDARGSANFMAGKFAASVADFDRAIKLDPKSANGHWRRGISLYYAGKYEDGKKQFEGYEKVDTNDVENAAWHFLCAAKKDGVEAARKGVLSIGKDRRVPMMEVYDLYKGKIKAADVLAAANAGELTDAQRKPGLFYAHLYLGLYYDLQDKPAEAKEHLALAAGKYRIDHYMGEVAVVHHQLLAKKK